MPIISSILKSISPLDKSTIPSGLALLFEQNRQKLFIMKGRPNNFTKTLVKSKSPVVVGTRGEVAVMKPSDKNLVSTAGELNRFNSSDAKIRVGMRQQPRSAKKGNEISNYRESNLSAADLVLRNIKIEKNGKNMKDEDENTTEQSSSQHISYVAGQYQLDSYDLFSRKKNVQFEQKVTELDKTDKIRASLGKSSSRNSSILKNSTRVLDRSMAGSSDKSYSVQNSFTAVKKCKIGFSTPDNSSNLQCKKKYQTIVEQLKQKSQNNNGQIRQKYIDDLFPPVEASLFCTSIYKKTNLINKNKQEIVWLRLSEIFNPKNMKVFSRSKKSQNTIIISDKGYSQPFLPCCFNGIKNNFQLLSNIFQSEQINPFGVYLLKIYQQNTWKYVIVDDLIPCVKKRNRIKREEKYLPIFVNIVVPEEDLSYIWPFLLEKAYANYYGCYQNLCQGNSLDFMSELTGAPYSEISFVHKRNLTPNIEKNLSIISKFITVENSTILGFKQQKNQYYPLFLLKDSYATDNTLLAYYDPLNNYEIISVQLNRVPETFDSVFIYAFKQYSNSINCPVYPPKVIKDKTRKPKEGKQQRTAKSKYIQIPQNDTISLRSFTIFKKTKCCINLRQKQIRFYYQCGINEYPWVRCLFVQKQYDGGYRWIHGKYSNSKHIILQQILEPGEYYLIIMVEWRQKYNKELTVVLYSNCDFLKFERKNYNKEDRVIELSCMDLSQRYGKLNQINKSICAYTYLCQETALIIENIVNERTKGDVTIMRSISGLKSKVQILPINAEFEVEIPEEYAALEKGDGKKFIDQSVEIDIKKGESFTVVLKMRGGVDRKFFKVFNFG